MHDLHLSEARAAIGKLRLVTAPELGDGDSLRRACGRARARHAVRARRRPGDDRRAGWRRQWPTADGALVVVEGPAGIGKSALLAHCGFLRARARGIGGGAGACERAGAGLCLWRRPPVVGAARRAADGEGRAGLFEGAARPAALVLGAEETGHAGASFGVLHGLYWVVVGLASEAPLVLCVDDVQWADWPSLRFLVHLARRLESTSVRAAARASHIRGGKRG